MITATTRTLNEERNIARFIEGYSKIADKIFIVDGGSEDDTVSIAESMGAVVEEQPVFVSKMTKYGEVRRNPQGVQINTCIQGAIDLGADWVIFDDADCVPTVSLQNDARMFMELSLHPAIYLHRLYLWGEKEWFPEMNTPGHSLWAWMPSLVDIWADEEDPWRHHMTGKPESRTILDYPFSVLHYFAPDVETVNRKLDFYNRAYDFYGHKMSHPLDANGRLDPLPEWAVWK